MAVVRPQTSPCPALKEKYTGSWSSGIAYWWARLDRMTAQSETRDRWWDETGRVVVVVVVTVVAVVVWFNISTLSLNKTGLAGGKEGGKRGDVQCSQASRTSSFFSLFTRERKARRNDVARNGDEKTENEGGRTSTRNLIMHGSWRKREEEKWMERGKRRGPTYAEGEGGKGDKIWRWW